MKTQLLRIFSLACVMFFLAASAQFDAMAQGDNKIQTLKIAVFTQELDLSPEEAEKFWPIYNDYETERKAVRAKYKKMDKSAGNDIARQEEELAVRKKYNAQFTAIIGDKADQLPAAEKAFKRILIEQLK